MKKATFKSYSCLAIALMATTSHYAQADDLFSNPLFTTGLGAGIGAAAGGGRGAGIGAAVGFSAGVLNNAASQAVQGPYPDDYYYNEGPYYDGYDDYDYEGPRRNYREMRRYR